MKMIMRFFCAVIAAIVLFTDAFAADFEDGGAKSLILIDKDTGAVLYENNADERLCIASVTKIMNLLLCMEAVADGKISFNDMVTASEHACGMGGSQIYLKAGEAMTVSDMVKAVAVASANDAAVALAEHIGGSESVFVTAMNKKARELNMKNTNFVNCNGLDTENHFSSARDVAIMSAELLKHEEILPYLKIWTDSLRNGEFSLANTNKLIRFYPDAIGIKTGFTNSAGYCVSAAAVRNDLTLIAVVLGAESSSGRFETAKALLNYGFANFKRVTPVEKGEKIADVGVAKGTAQTVRVVTGGRYCAIINIGSDEKFEKKIVLPESVKAPVEKGEKAGEIIVCKNKKEVYRLPLVYDESVKKLSIGDNFYTMLKYWSFKN